MNEKSIEKKDGKEEEEDEDKTNPEESESNEEEKKKKMNLKNLKQKMIIGISYKIIKF